MISIIIPVKNEQDRLLDLITHFIGLPGEFEIIISDCGAWEATARLVGSIARVIPSEPGRGIQCNNGAAAAKGDIYFFLHADSRVQVDVLTKIEAAIAHGHDWGCLKLQFDEQHPLMAIGAWKSNMRVRFGRIVFGDQGIFMTKEMFHACGGFPPLPLMEDYQLSLNLRDRKIRPIQINSTIVTSARRFRQVGRIRLGYRMHRLRYLYRKGANIHQLAAEYRRGAT